MDYMGHSDKASRSLVAVCTFMASELAIATISHYAGGLGLFTEAKFSPLMNYDL